MRALRALAGAAAAAIALAGCAGFEFLQPEAGVEFELSGRIAVRFRDEATNANLRWRHAREADELLLNTPFGQALARIRRSGDTVVLETADDRRFEAPDAETLTERALGFRLPLAGLASWVRARAADGPRRERRDARGRLLELEQDGWTIAYLAYAGEGADALPRRMRLNYPALELRLAIDAWRDPDGAK